jgi:MFS transporter, SP family, solute carrier family 2 (myo-inositol transporter), member 13
MYFSLLEQVSICSAILESRSDIVSPVLICTSFSLEQLIIGRIILGTGVGTAACVAPLCKSFLNLYREGCRRLSLDISELAPTRLRGTLVTIQSLMITGAQAVSYAIGAGMTFHSGWRALFAISTVPAIVQSFLIHFGLPESPRYDLMQNRRDSARKTMMIVYKGATDEQIDLKLRVLEVTVKHVQAFHERYTVRQRFKILMTDPMLRRVTFTSCIIMVFRSFSLSQCSKSWY